MPHIRSVFLRPWPAALLLVAVLAGSAGLAWTREPSTAPAAPSATPVAAARPPATRETRAGAAAAGARRTPLGATTITVEPGGQKVNVNTVRVRITFKNPGGFTDESITLRGVDLWSVTRTPWNYTVVSRVNVAYNEWEDSEAYVDAELPLEAGANELMARACPWPGATASNPCVTRRDTFTYDPNMDVDPPSAAFAPGSYSRVYQASLPVTVQWQDNRVLIPSTLQATLNGAAVTLSYAAADSAHGTLSGTLALRDGANELQARICDREGNCGTATARYVLDRTPQRPPPPMTDSAQTAPGMVVPGAQVRRDMCLAIAAGAGASYECGDLRLAHALPPVRLFGGATAPALAYSSQHAHPTPVFPFNVSIDPGSVPSSVRAVLRVAPVGQALAEAKTGSWADAGWSAGGIWRFALSYDASAAPTGVYAYQLEVLGTFAGVERQMALHAGEFALVNRAGGPFGAGWSVAGYEELHQVAGGGFLLVLGDGSTRRYTSAGAGVWLAPAVDRPDTLRAYAASDGTHYYRTLPNGTQVWYDPSLRHSATVSRLSRTTRFVHVNGRLDRIELPAPSAGLAAGFQFSYDGSGRLASACAYATHTTCRGVSVQYALGDRRVTGFTDPDSRAVQFGYQGNRVTSRTDRRGVVTSFAYGDAGRLRESSLPVPEAGHTIVHRFTPGETRGLAVALPAARAGTVYDGPRTDAADTTTFWLNRWGAPTRVQDAMGGVMGVTRGDSRFPALVTESVAANGLRTRAHYDHRGRPDSVLTLDPLGEGSAAPVDGATRTAVVPMDNVSAEWEIGGVANMGDDASGDIVWQNRATGETGVWIMNGIARVRWVPIASTGTSGEWRVGGVADMTGDGKPDIIWQNLQTFQVGIWQMDGTTLVGWVPMSASVAHDWMIGGVADMTGDGKPDLVWQNVATGEVGVWIMNGTTVVGWVPVANTSPGGEWRASGAANMTGDASPDILWHNRATRQTGVWVMSGTTLARSAEMLPAESADFRMVGAGDMTGDGRPDILWRNPVTLQTHVWVMGAPGGRSSLTTYAYDDRWNLPTRISTFEVSPSGVATPLAGSSEMAYDARGNRVWQQDGRGESGRVEFFYNAAGQITSSRLPSQRASGAMRDSIEYDAWGNVSRVRTPGGLWSATYKDALGRDTLAVSPIDLAQTRFQRQRMAYDVMDRVLWTETSAPDTDGRNGAQTVRVVTEYDADGAPRKTSRTMSPDPNGIGVMWTEYARDAAGRVYREVTPGNEWVETFYNPAGQVVAVRPRLVGGITNANELTIRMTYDALGRLTRRTTPAMVYPIEPLRTGVDNRSYPLYSLEPGSATPGRLAGDTSVFVYDRDGNMVVAANRDAVVTRSYYPNGAVRGDTLAIRTYAGADFTSHVYGLEYTYDVAGRRTRLGYPQNVVGAGAAASYAYNAQSGALETVTALGANAFSFAYNADGQLQTLVSPGNITETNTYNAEGQLQVRSVNVNNAFTGDPLGLPAALRRDSLTYDARGKIVRVSGPGGMTNQYAAMGALSRAYSTLPSSTQLLTADALGNTVRDTSRTRNDEGQETRTVQTHRYSRDGTGRLLASSTQETDITAKFVASDTTIYDPAGNRIHYSARTLLRWDQIAGGDPPLQEAVTLDENTRSYYDAEGRLRATDRRRCVARPVAGAHRCVNWEPAPGRDPGAFEEYRYDALGRRVLVRTRYETGQCGVYLEQCRNKVVRTVWEGDQLLLELRATNDAYPEMDTEWVAYSHGPGIDAPLAVRVRSDRVGTAARDIIPLPNWRGLYDAGVFPNGSTYVEGLNLKEIEWAGRNYRAFFDYVHDPAAPEPVWLGSLLTHKRDASGQLYMRNRYFDPTSGRFTQEDPIGIAGGLNLYGFGGGDPVTYSDPYGLCPYAANPDGQRTTNVSDCPDDERRPVFQRMARTRTGRLAISRLASSSAEVRMISANDTNTCGSSANGCFDPMTGEIALRRGRGASALSTTAVHEIHHLYMHMQELRAEVPGGWWLEAAAYGEGFQHYRELPASLRDDASLNYWAFQMVKDPGGTMKAFCNNSAAYSRLGCPR